MALSSFGECEDTSSAAGCDCSLPDGKRSLEKETGKTSLSVHYPEYLFFKWIVLRIVIWLLFWSEKNSQIKPLLHKSEIYSVDSTLCLFIISEQLLGAYQAYLLQRTCIGWPRRKLSDKNRA